MKTKLLFTFLILATWASTAFSQGTSPQRTISVSGSAEVKVAPDEIYLRLGVESRQTTLEDAKKQNDEGIAKALAFLKKANVNSKDVQTDYISIEPIYDSNVSRLRPVTFLARKSMEVKLTSLEKFEGVLAGLLGNGINVVHGIEFRTSHLRKHRDTARAMAIRAAKEKADALATELGVKKGSVITINANDWGGSWSSSGSYWGGHSGRGMYQNAVQNAGGAEMEGGTLSAGQISISATVNVSFSIE